jgi:hypothetical protein
VEDVDASVVIKAQGILEDSREVVNEVLDKKADSLGMVSPYVSLGAWTAKYMSSKPVLTSSAMYVAITLSCSGSA